MITEKVLEMMWSQDKELQNLGNTILNEHIKGDSVELSWHGHWEQLYFSGVETEAQKKHLVIMQLLARYLQ